MKLWESDITCVLERRSRGWGGVVRVGGLRKFILCGQHVGLLSSFVIVLAHNVRCGLNTHEAMNLLRQ